MFGCLQGQISCWVVSSEWRNDHCILVELRKRQTKSATKPIPLNPADESGRSGLPKWWRFGGGLTGQYLCNWGIRPSRKAQLLVVLCMQEGYVRVQSSFAWDSAHYQLHGELRSWSAVETWDTRLANAYIWECLPSFRSSASAAMWPSSPNLVGRSWRGVVLWWKFNCGKFWCPKGERRCASYGLIFFKTVAAGCQLRTGPPSLVLVHSELWASECRCDVITRRGFG